MCVDVIKGRQIRNFSGSRLFSANFLMNVYSQKRGEYWVINIANVFSYGFATKKRSGGLVQKGRQFFYECEQLCIHIHIHV